MATCYVCGTYNAFHRREVYNGRSTGSTFGTSFGRSGSRNFSSFSNRTYYGVRSVCEDCAKSIDRKNDIKTIVFQLILAIILFIILIK